MDAKNYLDQVYTAIYNSLDFVKKCVEAQRAIVERTTEQLESAVKFSQK